MREISRLARAMTWKWSAVDLFYGGAKAGILGDPSAPNKEEVRRAVARALADEVPEQYVFGLDMGMAEPDAATFVDELGATVVGVSNVAGTPVDPAGLDVEQLLTLRAEAGDSGIRDYGLPLRPVDEALLLGCDVLVPAARQDVIDRHIAERIRAQLVVEGANLPTSQKARGVLPGRGVAVVPDFIANAGGIIAAAYSMDARNLAFTVDESRIFATVSAKLRPNAVVVLEDRAPTGRTTFDAALALAQDRVRQAMCLRGHLRGDAAPVRRLTA